MSDPDNPEKSRAHSLIDAHLKRVYRDLEDQPLPDRFQQLLAQLRQQEEDDGGASDL